MSGFMTATTADVDRLREELTAQILDLCSRNGLTPPALPPGSVTDEELVERVAAAMANTDAGTAIPWVELRVMARAAIAAFPSPGPDDMVVSREDLDRAFDWFDWAHRTHSISLKDEEALERLRTALSRKGGEA